MHKGARATPIPPALASHPILDGANPHLDPDKSKTNRSIDHPLPTPRGARLLRLQLLPWGAAHLAPARMLRAQSGRRSTPLQHFESRSTPETPDELVARCSSTSGATAEHEICKRCPQPSAERLRTPPRQKRLGLPVQITSAMRHTSPSTAADYTARGLAHLANTGRPATRMRGIRG